MAAPKKSRAKRRGSRDQISDADDPLPQKKITGKDLTKLEELSARLTALVEILDEKGIINAKEYGRIVAMRLHEISKADAFQELEDEL